MINGFTIGVHRCQRRRDGSVGTDFNRKPQRRTENNRTEPKFEVRHTDNKGHLGLGYFTRTHFWPQAGIEALVLTRGWDRG